MNRRDFFRASAASVAAAATPTVVLSQAGPQPAAPTHDQIKALGINKYTPVRNDGTVSLAQAHVRNMRQLWERNPEQRFYIGSGDKDVYTGVVSALTPEENLKVDFEWYGRPAQHTIGKLETKEAVINAGPFEPTPMVHEYPNLVSMLREYKE